MNNAIFSPPKQVNGLPMASIVCDLCSRHQGSNAHDIKKAAAKHLQIWQEHEREQVEGLTQSYDAKVRERDAKIEELQRELDERPVQVVEKWVDAEVLEEAQEFAEQAYRSREHAFRQLCIIHINHHELPGERCSCGRSISDCDVVAVVEAYRALLRWERAQEEREERGLSHSLPYEYMKRLGRRGENDDPSEFDPYPHRPADS